MDQKSSGPLLEQAAQRFNLSVSQLSPLLGGHYAQVYEWVQNDQTYVLKISPVESQEELDSLYALLDWLDYLAMHNAPIVRRITSQNGNQIEPIVYNSQTYVISATQKLSGVRAETLTIEQWDAPLIQSLGHVLGSCHALAQTFTPPNPLRRRPAWDQMPNCFNPVDALATADPLLIERRAQALKKLCPLPTDRESYGLAHMDIHFANFIVDSQTRDIALIDFDDCGYGWYVMDAAMVLFDLLVVYSNEPRRQLYDYFLEEFVKGYREEKELPDFWLAQLPSFLKLLEIGVYAMLVDEYDPDTCEDGWVNTFMRDRERRIRQDVPYLD